RMAPWRSSLAQEIRLVSHDEVVERLEAEPADDVGTDLGGGDGGALFADGHRRPGGLRQKLGLAAAFHGDEPPRRFLDRTTDGQKPVVAQDHRLVRAERVGDSLALFPIKHDTRVVIKDTVVLIELARVLRQRVELAPEYRPRLAI